MDPLHLDRPQYDFYTSLYREQAPRVLQFIIRVSAGSVEDAQDILQQTFLVVLLKIEEAMAHENVVGYLMSIAANYIRHYWRDNKRKNEMEVSLELVPDVCDHRRRDDADLEVDQFTFPEWVTKRDREMLALYYLDGLSLKEIGQRYGLTYGSVRTHLSRLMKRLREQ